MRTYKKPTKTSREAHHSNRETAPSFTPTTSITRSSHLNLCSTSHSTPPPHSPLHYSEPHGHSATNPHNYPNTMAPQTQLNSSWPTRQPSPQLVEMILSWQSLLSCPMKVQSPTGTPTSLSSQSQAGTNSKASFRKISKALRGSTQT